MRAFDFGLMESCSLGPESTGSYSPISGSGTESTTSSQCYIDESRAEVDCTTRTDNAQERTDNAQENEFAIENKTRIEILQKLEITINGQTQEEEALSFAVTDWAFAARAILPDDICNEMAGYIISSPPPRVGMAADHIDGTHYITLSFPVAEIFLDPYMWHRDEHYIYCHLGNNFKVLVDNEPPANFDKRFVRTFHTNSYCTYDNKLRTVIKYGLIAALNYVFQVNGNHFPRLMKVWYEFVRLYLEERFSAQACRYVENEHIVVTCSNTHINVCFYPNGAASPIRMITEENEESGREYREYLISRDDLNENHFSPSLIDWSNCNFIRNYHGHCVLDENGIIQWKGNEYWMPFSSDVFTDSTHETLGDVPSLPSTSEYNTRTESMDSSDTETSDPAKIAFFRGFFEVNRADMAVVVPMEHAHATALVSRSIRDPNLEELGNPANLNNYVPDSGASQHMTPRLDDLENITVGQNLGVALADGHLIHVTTTGNIRINMLDDNGNNFTGILYDVMYVPGLSRRLFSLTRFAEKGHNIMISKNAICLHVGTKRCTLAMPHGHTLASNVLTVPDAPLVQEGEHVDTNTDIDTNADTNTDARENNDVRANNDVRKDDCKQSVEVELLRDRLGGRSVLPIIAASNTGLWKDTNVRMGPVKDFLSVKIATINASARVKHAHTPANRPGEVVLQDILPGHSGGSITPQTTYPAHIIFVDAYSRKPTIYGLTGISSTEVITANQQYRADYGKIDELGFFDVSKLKADAGKQFTSDEFKAYCRNEGIALSLAAPKKQYQNHFAEKTWGTVKNMARFMLCHARLPDSYYFHALLYACEAFSVLPVKGLLNKDGNPATPHELFTGEKPCISDFRVFGCPVVVKKYVARIDGNATSNQTQRGIRGIFIGFPRNQKGFLVFVPSTRQIVVSGDVVFDETFYCAIATTWRPFHDSLALRPISSNAPTGDMTVEVTGTIDDVFPSLQEGNLPNFTATEEDSSTNMVPTTLLSSKRGIRRL